MVVAQMSNFEYCQVEIFHVVVVVVAVVAEMLVLNQVVLLINIHVLHIHAGRHHIVLALILLVARLECLVYLDEVLDQPFPCEFRILIH